jgi:hypothetical protein
MLAKTPFSGDPLILALAAVAYLQFKHFICDFVLQLPYQYLNKGKYGHPGGILHAAIHAAASYLLIFFYAPSFGFGIAIVAAEFIVHYHIDWTKELIVRRTGWQTANAGFWWSLGIDQLLHQWTYVAMVAILAGKLG